MACVAVQFIFRHLPFTNFLNAVKTRAKCGQNEA